MKLLKEMPVPVKRENQRLKAIVAGEALECRALKEVARANW